MSYEHDYKELVNMVLDIGENRETRAGPTRSVFGTMLHIEDMRHGKFPILTTRQIFYKGVFGELAAFIRGATRLEQYKALGCNYWDANAKAWPANHGVPPEKARVGKVYGAQWRKWGATQLDQLAELIHNLRHDRGSRRHLLTTYNPEELQLGCLPPCHLTAQFNVSNDNFLDCVVYMRSVDLILGLPSDVALYAALMILLGAELHMKPGNLTFMFGDTHIYNNHHRQWRDEQSQRPTVQLPTWQVQNFTTIYNFVPQDIDLPGYNYHERIQYAFNV